MALIRQRMYCTVFLRAIEKPYYQLLFRVHQRFQSTHKYINSFSLFGSNVSNTSKTVSSDFSNIDKLVKKMRHSRVFEVNFEPLGNRIKQSFEYFDITSRTIQTISKQMLNKFIIINITCSHPLYGSEFLRFVFMN